LIHAYAYYTQLTAQLAESLPFYAMQLKAVLEYKYPFCIVYFL
jgi:hypothetical protein